MICVMFYTQTYSKYFLPFLECKYFTPINPFLFVKIGSQTISPIIFLLVVEM